MKGPKLSIVITALLIGTNAAQDGWFQQTSGTTADLNSVFFLDSLNGWIVGDDSTILKTTNGGEEWVNISSGYSGYHHNYKDIFFINNSIGLIVGGNYFSGIILRSTNRGESWERITDNNMRGLYSLSFYDDKIGFASGGTYFPATGIILKTEDSGLKWDTSLVYNGPPAYDDFFDIDFVSPKIGWAVGGHIPAYGNIILKTIDGGESWISQWEDDAFYPFPFTSCDFISELEGWVTIAQYRPYYADAYAVLYTNDGGKQWEKQKLPYIDTLDGKWLNAIFYVNVENIWCAGTGIFHSTNKGRDWIEQEISNVQYPFFESIFFINENLGWVVGQNGTILKTTNGGVTFIEEEEINELPTQYYLSNNFPNPFNPSTRITYSIPQTSNVVIKVFDVLGNEIESLVNEEKPTGTYELTWYAEGLPNGVYFYQLKTENFIETKKMILIK